MASFLATCFACSFAAWATLAKVKRGKGLKYQRTQIDANWDMGTAGPLIPRRGATRDDTNSIKKGICIRRCVRTAHPVKRNAMFLPMMGAPHREQGRASAENPQSFRQRSVAA